MLFFRRKTQLEANPVQAITSQSDVDQSVVDQAIQNRSGMPVRLN
ncbi:hypothetical protein ACHQIV_18870 [Klebsiella michiganensis]|nr:hypothetical protein [Klebsiella michiganensis]